MSAAALARIEAYVAQNRTFYLQLGYHEPHRAPTPGVDADVTMGFLGDYLAPDSVRGVTIPRWMRDSSETRVELAELQGAIHYLDQSVGALLHGLERIGIVENTIVIFTTDHGVALPRAKCTLYDPGIEVALLLRYPARGWSGGRTTGALLSNLDLFPTLLDALDLPIPANVHGRSLAPILDGDVTRHRGDVFAEITYHDYYDPRRAIRTDQHKLIVNFTNAPSFMDPSQSWLRRTRPIVPAAPAVTYTPPVELYDLTNDPLEADNLADDPASTERRFDLLQRLHAWMRSTGDPLLAGAVTSPRHDLVRELLSQGG
jgi:arylsulfatase A-like enzyme